MKKSLSLFLAFVMVAMLAITALPLAVFAADTGTYTSDADAIAAGMVFRIGNLDTTNGSTYATTLNNALSVATGESVTVYQIQNYNGDALLSVDTVVSGVKTIVLDGQNFDFKTTNGAYQQTKAGTFESLTIQNYGTLELGRGYWFRAYHLTYKNITNLSTKDRPVAIMEYGIADDASTTNVVESASLNFINVTADLATTGKSETGVRLGADVAASRAGNITLNVQNSTLNWKATNGGGSGHNSSLIATNKTEGNIFVNVDTTSKLSINCASGTASAQFVYTGSAGVTANINLANGAELIHNAKGSNYSFFAGNGTLKLTDNGAKYTTKAGASAINFPTMDGKIFVSGSTKIASGAAYTNTTGTDMTFTAQTGSVVITDDNALQNGYYFKVGTEFYTTLESAVNAAKTAGTATISMIGDYKSGDKVTVDGAYTITVEGNGHTFTKISGDNYFMYLKNGANVTFQNATLTLLGGVVSQGNATCTFKNITATTSSRPIWKNNGGTGNSVIFDNAKATMTATKTSASATHGQNMILSEYAAQGSMTVKNGSVLTQASESGIAPGNNALINIAETSVLNVTVENGCELINAVKKTTYGQNNGTIIYVSTSSDSTLTLASGSKLTVTANDLTTTEFIHNNGKMTVADNGCTYKVSAAANKAVDVTLPALTTVNGKSLLAFSNGTAMVGTKVAKNENATADVVLTAVGFDQDQFALLAGASIRTESPYGIRFTAQVNKDLYAQLVAADANVEFGIVLGAKRYIFGESFFTDLANQNTKNYAKIVCSNMTDVGNNKQFAAAVYITGDENLANAGKTQFETQMTARAYFTIHFADGTTQTIWTEYDATANTRSLYDVAKAYYEDASITDGSNKNNATINKILTACGYTAQ